ncbi:hypothetical protein EDB83DRAFT_2233134, partial [Lactarius deliciosus]
RIFLESLLALFLGIIGASVKAPALKEIKWASEMETNYKPTRGLYVDTRMGFANFVTTGRVLGQDRANRSGQHCG